MSILTEIKLILEKLDSELDQIKDKPITLNQKTSSFIFKKRGEDYKLSSIKNTIKRLDDSTWKLTSQKNKESVIRILNCVIKIKEFHLNNEPTKIKLEIKKIKSELINITDIQNSYEPLPTSLSVPSPIKDEINADLKELNECFKHGLYRSSIILCGRILEVTLHRKYFDLTKKDILETQPGIGLGKLVAKLYEKGALFDPGINEQIHLINKVRIHSVHKKQELFKSTKDQTYATILYTLDIVKRLFS